MLGLRAGDGGVLRRGLGWPVAPGPSRPT